MSLPQPTALVLRGQRFDAARPAVVDALACAELYLALAQELGIKTLAQALRWS